MILCYREKSTVHQSSFLVILFLEAVSADRLLFGAIMIYETAKWERVRKSILRRDGYMCQECKRYGKRREGNHVHHIFPVEHYPELAWEPKNMITLCQNCHNAMHDRDTHELSKKGEQLRERIKRKTGIS